MNTYTLTILVNELTVICLSIVGLVFILRQCRFSYYTSQALRHVNWPRCNLFEKVIKRG